MKIFGLQKMTLLDFPGRVACTVFLGGCDFACPYCHNFELVNGDASPLMEEDEFFSFLDSRHNLLDGVAVTGGEPLLSKGLADFLRRIKERGFLVKLDTNGNHPNELFGIIEDGIVDYIAMDIKNSPEKYARTCGLKQIELTPIKKSIEIIKNSGIEYEFRTTVVEGFHETEDFFGIGSLIGDAMHYYIQVFVDRDTVPTQYLGAPENEKIKNFLKAVLKYTKSAEIRGLD